MPRIAAAALALSCLGLLACKGEDKPKSEGKPAIEEAEAARGRKACEAYLERACRCAASNPALAETCEDAQGRPEALDMNLRAAVAGGDLNRAKKAAVAAAARRMIAACIELDAKLDPATCPRAE
jgi:hypothetical protein